MEMIYRPVVLYQGNSFLAFPCAVSHRITPFSYSPSTLSTVDVCMVQNDKQKELYRLVSGPNPLTSPWCRPVLCVTATVAGVVLLPSEIWRS